MSAETDRNPTGPQRRRSLFDLLDDLIPAPRVERRPRRREEIDRAVRRAEAERRRLERTGGRP